MDTRDAVVNKPDDSHSLLGTYIPLGLTDQK